MSVVTSCALRASSALAGWPCLTATWRELPGVAIVRGPLLACAVAVLASRPAAGPALAFLQLLPGPPNTALPGGLLLGILDPADELVAGQWRDVVPGVECRRVG